jgi:hypothetical protein
VTTRRFLLAATRRAALIRALKALEAGVSLGAAAVSTGKSPLTFRRWLGLSYAGGDRDPGARCRWLLALPWQELADPPNEVWSRHGADEEEGGK